MRKVVSRAAIGVLSAVVSLSTVGYFMGPVQDALALSVRVSHGYAVVYGKVTSNGQPVSGVRVDLQHQAGKGANFATSTAHNGTYRIAKSLSTGRYVVTMTDPAKGLSAQKDLTIHKEHAYRVSARIVTAGGFHFYLPIFSY